jgi:hypothetical protein
LWGSASVFSQRSVSDFVATSVENRLPDLWGDQLNYLIGRSVGNRHSSLVVIGFPIYSAITTL